MELLPKLLKNLLKTESISMDNWDPLPPKVPALLSAEHRVGPLRFGDTFAAASIFGRPDLVNHGAKDCVSLVYAQSGFEIEFQEDRLGYVAYFLADDKYLPKTTVTFSKPEIDGARFSSTTSLRDVERALGSPTSRDDDPSEIIWFFTRNGVTLEFEATTQGTLKRINAYPVEG